MSSTISGKVLEKKETNHSIEEKGKKKITDNSKDKESIKTEKKVETLFSGEFKASLNHNPLTGKQIAKKVIKYTVLVVIFPVGLTYLAWKVCMFLVGKILFSSSAFSEIRIQPKNLKKAEERLKAIDLELKEINKTSIEKQTADQKKKIISLNDEKKKWEKFQADVTTFHDGSKFKTDSKKIENRKEEINKRLDEINILTTTKENKNEFVKLMNEFKLLINPTFSSFSKVKIETCDGSNLSAGIIWNSSDNAGEYDQWSNVKYKNWVEELRNLKTDPSKLYTQTLDFINSKRKMIQEATLNEIKIYKEFIEKELGVEGKQIVIPNGNFYFTDYPKTYADYLKNGIPFDKIGETLQLKNEKIKEDLKTFNSSLIDNSKIPLEKKNKLQSDLVKIQTKVTGDIDKLKNEAKKNGIVTENKPNSNSGFKLMENVLDKSKISKDRLTGLKKSLGKFQNKEKHLFEVPPLNLANQNFVLYIPDNDETYEEAIDPSTDFFKTTINKSNFAVFNYREGARKIDDLVNDADAIYQYLVLQLGIPKDMIMIHGRGVGGIIAAKLAEQNEVGAVLLERTAASNSAIFAGKVESWIRADQITKKDEKKKESEEKPHVLSPWRRELAGYVAKKVECFVGQALRTIGWEIDAADLLVKAKKKNQALKIYYSEAKNDELVQNSAKISQRVLELNPRYTKVDPQIQKDFNSVRKIVEDNKENRWTTINHIKKDVQNAKEDLEVEIDNKDSKVIDFNKKYQSKLEKIELETLFTAIKSDNFDDLTLFSTVFEQIVDCEASLNQLKNQLKKLQKEQSEKMDTVAAEKIGVSVFEIDSKLGALKNLKNLCETTYINPNDPLFEQLYLNFFVADKHEKSVFEEASIDLSHRGPHLNNKKWIDSFF